MLLALAACHSPQREARRMLRQAEQLFDTLPDSTASLIDSVLHIPVYFSERQRMGMALLQAEALFGDRGQEIPPVMDDDFFDDKPFLSTSPDLERAAAYYAGKEQYDKAAHAALYSGFVQQHYNEKSAAMQSFKDAERYGGFVGDSLTVAQAECLMSRLLYDDGMEKDALDLLIIADNCLGKRYADKALVQNMMAVCYMIQGDYEEAETCLQQSLMFSEKSQIIKLKSRALNNYAVLYRQQQKYDQAIDCLRQTAKDSDFNDTESFIYYLNMGKTFMAKDNIDSATLYYHCLEEILPTANVKNETKVSAYNALSRFAESQGDAPKALMWREKHGNALYEVMFQRQEQNTYRVQQQYDYESLQNEMNRKLIRRQHFITFISVLSIIGLAALAVSQIRIAKIRKQEAEAKSSLFHFLQQHKELQQKHETSEQTVMSLSMKHNADSKAHQDLIVKYEETEKARLEYAQRLSDALTKEALIMRKLGIYLDNKGEKAYLGALNDAVFGRADRWDALMEVFDTLYPDVRENLKLQHPELTEMEQKDFILSYFNISREDEALMFNKSVHMVDKWRNSVRKKMQASDAIQHQKN